MARPRNKNSNNSFGGLGLDTEEDKKLQKVLKDKDVSLKQLTRMLLRQYLDSYKLKV
jgi:hypothetical protein